MAEYDRYDMNESVKHVILASAPKMHYIEAVREAIERAAEAAECRVKGDGPRELDLLAQVKERMPAELLAEDPVHLGRYEFYATPLSMAYAYITSVMGDDPEEFGVSSEEFCEFNSTLAFYESRGGPNNADDAYYLRDAAEEINQDLEALSV